MRTNRANRDQSPLGGRVQRLGFVIVVVVALVVVVIVVIVVVSLVVVAVAPTVVIVVVVCCGAVDSLVFLVVRAALASRPGECREPREVRSKGAEWSKRSVESGGGVTRRRRRYQGNKACHDSILKTR